MRYFTAGPSQVAPTVAGYIRDAMEEDICSISHRSKDFERIRKGAADSLKKLLSIPEGFHIFFLGSATEAMERLIQNCVKKKSFHLVNGAFSKKFFSISKDLGRSPEKIEVGFGEGFKFPISVPDDSEMVCVTHTETSTGVMVPEKDIASIKIANPKVILAVDMVSSAPNSDLDYSKVDAAFFSVQKGFGLPAGLGVLIVNDRCIEKSLELQKEMSIGSYHSLPSLLAKEKKDQTPETPNVLGIYLLWKMCEEMLEKGIDNLRKETEIRAGMIYDKLQKRYSLFVKDAAIRAPTMIVVNTPDGSAQLIEKLKEKGYLIGSGYGEYKDKQVRIANYTNFRLRDVEGLVNCFEK